MPSPPIDLSIDVASSGLSRRLSDDLLAGARLQLHRAVGDNLPCGLRVAVLSGTPKMGSVDPWGGLGDIAANVQVASRLRRRNPSAYICLIVCDLPPDEFREARDAYPEARSASAILATMIPAFNPDLRGVCQTIDGLDVLVPDVPIMSRALRHGTSHVVPALGTFDVAVTFNDNHSSSARLLRMVAPLRFTIDEPGRDGEALRRSDLVDVALGEHCLNAGAYHLGYHMDPLPINPLADPTQRQDFVSRLSTMAGRRFPPRARFAFMYPGRESSGFDYAALLMAATSRLAHDTVVLALGAGRAAASVKSEVVVALPDLGHADFERLIWLSDMPPIVTGDVSVSLAIEATARGRGLIYSRPSWKGPAIRDLERLITDSHCLLPRRRLSSQHFRTSLHSCLWASASDLSQPGSAEALVAATANPIYQDEMARAVQAICRSLSAVKNLELLIVWALIADPIFNKQRPPEAMDESVLALVRRSADVGTFIDNIISWLVGSRSDDS